MPYEEAYPYCIPICVRGFPFVQLHSPVHTVDCMVVPVIRFQTTLVRFLVYGSCCDMLHSEVALVAKHWWVDLIAILG